MASFQERYAAACRQNRSLLCVGLDVDPARLPEPLRGQPRPVQAFVEAVVSATADLVCAYKPNLAFYLANGLEGLEDLTAAVRAIRRLSPDVPILLDAKFGDIDSTAAAYARFAYDVVEADAVTLSPYLGEDALRPFLERSARTAFVLCKTSNAGGGDFQDLELAAGGRLYERVARRIGAWSETYGAIGAVVGATYPSQVAEIRAILPTAPLLVPGVGAQGGALEATVRHGVDATGGGILVNASRAVLYASAGADYADRVRAVAADLMARINAAKTGC